MVKIRENLAGYSFGFISIAGLFWIYIIPFVRSVIRTIIKIDEDGLTWNGARLYQNLFLRSTFGQTLKNTLLFALVGLPVLLVFTAAMTYFIDRLTEEHVKGTSFWFAVLLLPMILPSVVISTIVKIFFSPYGVINAFLDKIGAAPVSWMDSAWTFLILCVIFWWKNTGYSMVVLLSGVQNVEKEQREAAALDGAGSFTVFLKIILPQLSVFIRFIVIMGIMGIFKLYRESYLILGDTPPDEAYMIQNFLNNNFASLNFDRTIAASALLFLLIGSLLLLLFKITGKRAK